MRIPVAQRTTQSVGLTSAPKLQQMNVPTSVEMFGAQRAQDMSKLAKGLMDVSNTVEYIGNDMMNAEAKEASNKLTQDFAAWQSEQKKKRGKDGMNSEADYQSWYKAKQAELTADMGDVVKGRFLQAADMQNAAYGRWASDYGYGEMLRYEVDTQEAMISVASNMIAENSDSPEIVAQELDKIAASEIHLGRLQGRDAKVTAENTRIRQEQALIPAIEMRIAEGRLGLARGMVEQYGNIIGGKAEAVLGKQISNEAKRQAAEAKAARAAALREQQLQVKVALEDWKDDIYVAQRTGDVSKLRQAQAQVLKLGDADTADKMGQEIDLVQNNIEVIEESKTLTIGEMGERIVKARGDLSKISTAQEGKKLEGELKILETIYESKQKILAKDPVAAVAHLVPKDTQSKAEETRYRLDLQAQEGVLSGEMRVLTDGESASLGNAWKTSDADKKVRLYDEISQSYGQYSPDVLSEIGVSPLEQISMGQVAQDPKRRDSLLRVIAAKSLKSEDAKGTIAAEVQSVYTDSKVYQAYMAQFSLMPQSTGLQGVVTDIQSTAKGLLYINGNDVGKATSDIDGNFDALLTSNVSVAYDTTLIDGDVLEDGLEFLQSGADLDVFLKNRADLNTEDRQNYIRFLKNNAVWVNGTDGNFMLIDPVSRVPVRNQDGTVYEFGIDAIKNKSVEFENLPVTPNLGRF